MIDTWVGLEWDLLMLCTETQPATEQHHSHKPVAQSVVLCTLLQARMKSNLAAPNKRLKPDVNRAKIQHRLLLGWGRVKPAAE